MIGLRCAAAMVAAGIFAAQPCIAADNHHDAGAREPLSSAFVGVNLRLPLGGNAGKPSARLQFTAASTGRDTRSGSAAKIRAHGFEIGLRENGKPALYMGGQDAAEMKTKLGVRGSATTTVVVVGGVLLLFFILASATQAPPSDVNK